MVALHRLKGLGWLTSCALVAITFYLVSSQVAAERKRLEQVDVKIAGAERDIRALETEFDVRASLAQLERWNGNTLALTVPTSAQFVRDEATLAALSPRDGGAAAMGEAQLRSAALIVPANPVVATPVVGGAAGGLVTVAAAKPVATARYDAVRVAAAGAVSGTAPVGAIRTIAAHAGDKPPLIPAVAMLDKSLLSAGTLGELMNGARAERSRLR